MISAATHLVLYKPRQSIYCNSWSDEVTNYNNYCQVTADFLISLLLLVTEVKRCRDDVV